MLSRDEIIKEYAKCLIDPIYAIETYLETFDKTQDKFVQFKLFPKQKDIIKAYEDHRLNIIAKPRQAGVSTVTAAYLAVKIAFADKNSPEAILILANKQDMAQEFLAKVKDFLSQMPRWVWGYEYYINSTLNIFIRESKKELLLPNGSRAKAVATSKDALRGYTPTYLVMDEAAFIDNGVEVFSAALMSLGCLKKDTLILTENGLVELYDLLEEKETVGFSELKNKFKVCNYSGYLEDVTKTFVSEKSTVYKIKTRLGLTLEGSWKHPILIGGDDENKWVKMCDLKVGDSPLITFSQQMFGKNDEIIGDYFDINLPLNLSQDEQLCRILGLIFFFGEVSDKISIKKEFIYDSEKIEKTLNTLLVNFYYENDNLIIDSKDFISFVNDIMPDKDNVFPRKILTSPKIVVENFIYPIARGKNDNIKYFCNNSKVLNDLGVLLLNLGYIPKIGNNYIMIYNDFIAEIAQYPNISYYFDKIVSIETYEDVTYDLHVPKTNSFISNGFISHNTGGRATLISCVTKDTFVFTDKGLRNVYDFIDEDKIGGYEIDEYNVLGKDKLRKGNLFKNNGYVETKKILTEYSWIEGSLNHKLFTYINGEGFKWTKLKNLRVGDRVAIQYGMNIWGNDDLTIDDITYKNGDKITSIDDKISVIIGYIISNKYTIGRKLLSSKVKNALKRINISEDSFLRLIKSIGIEINCDVSEIVLPKKLMSLSKKATIGLLEGIFTGSKYKNGELYLESESLFLLRQISMLLNNLGVLSKITKFIDNDFENTSITYKLSITGKFLNVVYSLFNRLVFPSNFNFDYDYHSEDNIPNLMNWVVSIKNRCVEYSETKLKASEIINKYKNEINREDLIILKHKLLKEKPFEFTDVDFDILSIISENIYWDKIISIKSSENYTYDFSLPHSEDFWCHSIIYNGILGHQTPNGQDPLYYETYIQAKEKKNGFNVIELRWYEDPRYNKNLRWVKKIPLDDGGFDEIVEYEKDFTIESYNKRIEDGWKPISDWYIEMCDALNGNKRMIAQELDVSFIGSGGNVISDDVIMMHEKTNVKEPEWIGGENDEFYIWKYPQNDHKYIMGCLPPGEKVLTNKGLKNIEDIDNNFKLINENGEYVNIINKQIYEVKDEPLYEIKLSHTLRTTKFTKEHPILVSKDGGDNFEYVKCENVNVGDIIKFPNVYKKNIIDINTIIKDFIDEDKEYIFKDEIFWWFVGVFIAKGTALNDNITIVLHDKQKRILENIKNNIANKLNIDLKIDFCSNTIKIEINDDILYKFFNKVFYNENNKIISEEIKHLDLNFKKHIIKGFFDGCGEYNIFNEEVLEILFVHYDIEILESIQNILLSLGVFSEMSQLLYNPIHNLNIIYLKLDNYYSYKLLNEILKEINVNDNIITADLIKEPNNIQKKFIENNDYILFTISNIDTTKYSGVVYNFECDTHTYICHHITTHNCDVARGDGKDYSTIVVIDTDEMEQVMEYQGKCLPDEFAEIIEEYGNLYNAFTVIDIAGGIGVSTILQLLNKGYDKLYYDKSIGNSLNKKLNIHSKDGKIPGFNASGVRLQMISHFEYMLRNNEFKIRSIRLVNELKTFVYNNKGRPDHKPGKNDDLIMASAMALWVLERSFKELEKSKNMTKAMINAWVSGKDLKQNIYNKRPNKTDWFINNNNNNQNDDYIWLFGKNFKK
jgi:intein/homing endonuclease